MHILFFGEIAGGVGILIGCGGLLFAKLSGSWPSTKGLVVASLVDGGFDSSFSSGSRMSFGYSEWARIAYEYSVGGRTYTRSQVYGGLDFAWSSMLPGLSSAAETVRALPLDAEVDVFYWPAFPCVACLRPGRFAGGIVLVSASIIIFCICWFKNHA